MNVRIFTLALLAGCTLHAVQPGDSLEKVLAEKGKPTSRVEGGESVILNYPDASITLRNDQVVTVKTKSEAQGRITPTSPSSPAGKPAARAGAPDISLEGWSTDYTSALEQAKAQNKQVFLFFTGSDWCPWCKRLNKEILATDEFVRFANEKLVLVKVDFPRTLPQADELKDQNKKLAQKYRIRGYPTVILLSPTGQPVGTLGYQEGGPGPFIQQLKHL